MGPVASVKVERVEQEPQASLVFGTTVPGKSGWVARVEFADGAEVVADRLDTEPAGEWHINGRWAAGSSFPIFWNGQLSRCTLPTFASAELAERLTAEVSA